MSQAIFAIRPQPGCLATVEAGSELGLTIEACPLFEVRPLPWVGPPPGEVDALLLGSANAIRHGGAGLAAFKDKPVYAVGGATAKAAQAAGFKVAATGSGGLQALLDEVPAPVRLLRLAGMEHMLMLPPPGIEIDTHTVYDTLPAPIPPAVAARLRKGALVLLHSAAAARHFRAECERFELPKGAISFAALGPRIAAAAGTGWHEVRSAPEPSEAALLALARDMCHDRPRG